MSAKQIYIIEHLEPELYEWCLIEYKHISKIVGKNNVWFTNIRKDANKLKKYGSVFTQSVQEMHLENPCILDPESNKLLSPKLASKFKYFIFGGILGNFPPKKRTKVELTQFLKNAKAFNIGKKQMSTDNAAYTVHEIASGIPMEKLKFKDKIEIKINEIESTIFPYRYNIVNGKPLVSKELIKYLKRKT